MAATAITSCAGLLTATQNVFWLPWVNLRLKYSIMFSGAKGCTYSSTKLCPAFTGSIWNPLYWMEPQSSQGIFHRVTKTKQGRTLTCSQCRNISLAEPNVRSLAGHISWSWQDRYTRMPLQIEGWDAGWCQWKWYHREFLTISVMRFLREWPKSWEKQWGKYGNAGWQSCIHVDLARCYQMSVTIHISDVLQWLVSWGGFFSIICTFYPEMSNSCEL